MSRRFTEAEIAEVRERVPFLGEPAGLANCSEPNAGQNAQDDCSDYDYAEIGHGSAPVDAPPTFHFSASGTAFQEKGRAYAGRGGPCEEAFTGETLDVLVKTATEHVMSSDDDAHKATADQMQNMSDEELNAWNAEMQTKFDAAPDVQ